LQVAPLKSSVGGEVAQDHGRVAEDAAEGVGRQDELADLLDRRDGLAHVGLDLVAGDADELARVGRIDVDVGVRRRVEELLELVVAWTVSRCVRQRSRTVLFGTDAQHRLDDRTDVLDDGIALLAQARRRAAAGAGALGGRGRGIALQQIALEQRLAERLELRLRRELAGAAASVQTSKSRRTRERRRCGRERRG